jgi:glycosyltransferase involved in cell wall biosynthesis
MTTNMKIAIIGSRGIPNHYGGFEQCAEYLALGFKNRGIDVTVYNSHLHPYQEKEWKGVKIVHCYDPEDKLGTAGQFIFDLNCILDLPKHRYDVVLQLGYTSSSVWGWLLPRKTVVTTNMDGLEWKRTKYSPKVRKFLLFAEKLGVKFSDYLISDSIGIQEYLSEKYKVLSTYIPYGANLFTAPNAACLAEYGLEPYRYDMLIARLEPENSIEIILDGVEKAALKRTFLVIGNHQTHYGQLLKAKYQHSPCIQFVGGIYDMNKLDNIRYFSNLYFHGHTVGGTNPSLLEAMASNCLICANQNPFNHHILGNDAFYFSNAEEVCKLVLEVQKSHASMTSFLKNNETKINDIYSWDKVTTQYADHLFSIKGKPKR